MNLINLKLIIYALSLKIDIRPFNNETIRRQWELDVEENRNLIDEKISTPSIFDNLKRRHGASQTILAGACFCLASGSMTLLNKAALSSFNFQAPDSLLFFQCSLSVILVKIFATFKLIKVEPFNWNIVRVWYPVNFIFVGMIATSFWALKDLGVPMSTVLKNMTNLMIVISEYFMFGRVYNSGIWASMGLMVLSALCGAFTDLEFNARGYFLADCK